MFSNPVDNYPLLRFVTRRAIARVISTLLCCLAIVVRPFSVLGGPSAFLVLALKELVFSVQENLAQQLGEHQSLTIIAQHFL
jgi:hypothetical protein